MNKWCAIAVLAVSAFAASAQAEVIVRFTVEVDPVAQSFDIFIEDFAPIATAPGQAGNGGIAGFVISFDQGFLDPDITNTIVIDFLEVARLQGTDPGTTNISGFDSDSEFRNHGLDTMTPEIFSIQQQSELVYMFGQVSGEIPNIFVPGFPNFDGPIPFSKPAFVGRGTYTGTLPLDQLGNPTLPVLGVGASVFAFEGASIGVEGEVITLPSSEVDYIILIPEPASFAMFVAGAGLMLTGRKRETR